MAHWINQPGWTVLSEHLARAALEWRDAREEIFKAGDAADVKSMPGLFARLATAEHRLMAVARMIPTIGGEV